MVYKTKIGAVITKQPKELMSKWLSQIPGGRTCQPQELKGVSSLFSMLVSVT